MLNISLSLLLSFENQIGLQTRSNKTSYDVLELYDAFELVQFS